MTSNSGDFQDMILVLNTLQRGDSTEFRSKFSCLKRSIMTSDEKLWWQVMNFLLRKLEKDNGKNTNNNAIYGEWVKWAFS